ncbi:MAG: hypothetical protein LC102_10695 [Ignavibacteriales bacterium]|nr:MAG: hypothetical protein F9K26_10305 [Ignavibacteriaceae bacterium]MBW7873653.1 hypothetical protein [Ignavibacteria bacterium]MCZ2143883.1 hypothetical protein [Ignavibacteriales bacterium]MBV6445846.1 hypothetical protein [Ignavibacteriaceae bacterium]MBZ0197513.1 hypothetical protein [Ignavibacteriaceae bacterium]
MRFLGKLFSGLVLIVFLIYLGVWLAVAYFFFAIVIFLVMLFWNNILSEYLPLPEIGWFGGHVVTIFLIVIISTIYFIIKLSGN